MSNTDAHGMDKFQQFIHLSSYSRWLEDKQRRETWEETVARYCDYWSQKYPEVFPKKKIYDAIINLEVMPSMRALMTAGPALDRDNVAGFNCAYLPIDNPRAFDEILYILCCGTGVGFSVERQYINQLPAVAEEFHDTDTVIQVADSKQGWASAFRELISLLYSGRLPKWDVSKVRPAGARLKTFGGRASGPGPLADLFNFTVSTFKSAAGRKLNSLECHDLVCKIGDIVVSGGVRRSAEISLSDIFDDLLRGAKTGRWYETHKHRALSNNSAAYTEKPTVELFMKEWLSLIESKSGERGIFNRVAATKKAAENGRRDTKDQNYGCNPCGEIILPENGFCNLSEVIARPEDDIEALKKKIEIATIIGTFQSTLTDYRYIRSVWKKNAEKERLLGVSMTGIMDSALLTGVSGDLKSTLTELKNHAIAVNKKWAEKLGINQSAAITTVKPSGTVSKLTNTSSGIHPRYAEYMIQTIRADKKDPLAKLMRDSGVPCEDDIMKPETNYVFSFPIKSPSGSYLRTDLNAIQQLEHYLAFQKYWCEHNPSITVYVKDSEWLEVGAWVYKNFDSIGGVSFLPYDDHVYKQAPWQEIDEEKYNALKASFPDVDWNKLSDYEKEDQTTSSHEYACVGNVCELVDLTK